MNALPYYKRFPRDLLEGTAGMPFEEKAAYAFLLDLIYLHNGALPDDSRFIAGHLGLSVRKWNCIRDALISRGKIRAESGIISNSRADKELETQRKFQDNQAEKARVPRKNKDLQEPRQSQRAFNQNQNHREAIASQDMADPVPAKPASKPREPDRFPEFWDAYGHKVAKGAAAKAWKAALRRADPETIIAAASGYAAVRDPNFVKHPATWLNGDGWEDDLSTYRRKEPRHGPAAREEQSRALYAEFNALPADAFVNARPAFQDFDDGPSEAGGNGSGGPWEARSEGADNVFPLLGRAWAHG